MNLTFHKTMKGHEPYTVQGKIKGHELYPLQENKRA
jgi:hypothetical protein